MKKRINATPKQEKRKATKEADDEKASR